VSDVNVKQQYTANIPRVNVNIMHDSSLRDISDKSNKISECVSNDECACAPDLSKSIEVGCMRDASVRALYDMDFRDGSMTNQMCQELCKITVRKEI
jgi:hypothetical protein